MNLLAWPVSATAMAPMWRALDDIPPLTALREADPGIRDPLLAARNSDLYPRTHSIYVAALLPEHANASHLSRVGADP